MPKLAARWNQIWERTTKAPPENLYTHLVEHYTEPQRAYHTLQHIEECLRLFESVRHLAENPIDVELAIWFHDVIYDPKASDNEERSADFAVTALKKEQIDAAQIEHIWQLINVTKHTEPAIGADAQILIDVDLSILGAVPTRFNEYEEQIRFEYAWVPWRNYCKRRADLLDRFLARPTIYATEQFIANREEQARQNILRSLGRLNRSSLPA